MACGHREIAWNPVESEPFHFLRFVGLAVSRLTAYDSTEIGWSDPVLPFSWQNVIRDAEQTDQFNLHSGFLAGFANGALIERLQKIDLSADDAPAAGFGRPFAQGQEDPVRRIKQEHADTDAGDGARFEPMVHWFASLGQAAKWKSRPARA